MGVTFVKYEDGHNVYELASGSYEFASQVNPEMNNISSVKLANSQNIDAEATVNGKTYDCEAFATESGTKFEYCYLNSEIQMLIITNGDDVQTRAISNLKMGADTEKLDIPSDYTRDDSFFADFV